MLGTPFPSIIFALFPRSKSSIIKAHDCKNTTLPEEEKKKKDILKACELSVLQKFFNILIFKTLATGKKSRLSKILRLEFKLKFGTAKIAPLKVEVLSAMILYKCKLSTEHPMIGFKETCYSCKNAKCNLVRGYLG